MDRDSLDDYKATSAFVIDDHVQVGDLVVKSGTGGVWLVEELDLIEKETGDVIVTMSRWQGIDQPPVAPGMWGYDRTRNARSAWHLQLLMAFEFRRARWLRRQRLSSGAP